MTAITITPIIPFPLRETLSPRSKFNFTSLLHLTLLHFTAAPYIAVHLHCYTLHLHFCTCTAVHLTAAYCCPTAQSMNQLHYQNSSISFSQPHQRTLPTRWGNWCWSAYSDSQLAASTDWPCHWTRTSVMVLVLNCLDLVWRIAIGSGLNKPSASTRGKVGIGITLSPNFSFK